MLQYGPVFLTGVCILISWKALLMILFIWFSYLLRRWSTQLKLYWLLCTTREI
jgi:hypothetical protein